MRTKFVIGVGAGAIACIGLFSATGRAFNTRPDSPGFGLVTLVVGQSIRVNVVCSEHAAGRTPPGPCTGDLMVHDMEGNTLTLQRVELRPGQAASLAFDLPRDAAGPAGIDPCWVPADGNLGLAIPSAEVFRTETGETTLFLNPAVARLSALATDPS
jgi:hypothetical protein